MTDEQQADLYRLRMKASQPEMVTVPKELLREVLDTALGDIEALIALGENINATTDKARIAALRQAAGLDTYARKSYGPDWGTPSDEVYAGRATDDILKAEGSDQ